MKQTIVSLSKTGLISGLIKIFETLDRESPNLLRVLMYHRVDEPTAQLNLSPSMLSATPADFAQQMEFVRDHCTPVSVQDVLGWQTNGLPRRAVLVTFDDAYRDFAEHAWPIARERDIPITLFVPTDYPDQPERVYWWDELYDAITTTTHDTIAAGDDVLNLTTPVDRKRAFKVLRNYVKSLPHEEAMAWVRRTCDEFGRSVSERNIVLGWDELRDLANEGVTLGAHTWSHPMMNRISLEQARQEAVQSRNDIQEHIGSALPIFAYPSGYFSDAVVEMLRDEGFELAFTTNRGINHMGTTDPLRLRRINVGMNTSLPIMRGQLLAFSRYFFK